PDGPGGRRHRPGRHGADARTGRGPDGVGSPSMQTVTSFLVHELVYFLSANVMPLLFGLRVEGGRRIPAAGAALLIANHQSFLDPILLGLCTHRPLRYLARKTLFKNALFAWLIRSLSGVPIDQEG